MGKTLEVLLLLYLSLSLQSSPVVLGPSPPIFGPLRLYSVLSDTLVCFIVFGLLRLFSVLSDCIGYSLAVSGCIRPSPTVFGRLRLYLALSLLASALTTALIVQMLCVPTS